MKKAAIFCFLFAITYLAFAQSADYREECRRILYAAKPVDAIGALDNATLNRLGRYSMGIPVAGQAALSDTDTELFSFLATTEIERRERTKDAFSLYLQEEHERLVPLMRRSGDVTMYVKEDGWLDLFKLDLMFAD